MEPIRAGCGTCGAKLFLRELPSTGGRCPTCGEVLAPGYSTLLVEEARRADDLQRQYVTCLRRLAGLPGGMDLDADALVRSAVTSVGLDDQLAEDGRLIRQIIDELPRRVRAWRWLPRAQRTRQAPRLVATIRELAERLHLHRGALEQAGLQGGIGVGDPTPLLHAAKLVEEAADAVTEERRACDDFVRRAVEAAVDALDPVSTVRSSPRAATRHAVPE